MIFVCPKAPVWYQTFERLREAWTASGRVGDEPPMPLLLAGWIYSSDRDKQVRWNATVLWAEERALSHLIPQLAPEDQYCTDLVTTSYPEQRYRPDRYVCRERPSDEAIDAAMQLLKRDWRTIAGDALAEVCHPTKFTGRKRRRLLVLVTQQQQQPPWGSWHTLAQGAERRAFSDFRCRVNNAVAPVHVDHIDFCIRENGA